MTHRPGHFRAGFEAATRDPERRAFFDLSKRISELEDALQDAVDKLPRGIVAVGTMATPSPVAGTAGVAVNVSNVLNFTPVSGRRYRLTCKVRAIFPSASGSLYMRCAGSHNLGTTDVWTWIHGANTSAYFEQVFVGTGVASTYQMTMTGNGINLTSIYTDQATSHFYIEDVGGN